MIHALRARTAHDLWHAFSSTFLDELGAWTGPGHWPAAAWLTHRVQRDLLYRDAAARGIRGWLNPPTTYFSELPTRFGILQRPIGLVERQALLDHLSALHAPTACPPCPPRPP